MHETSEHTSSYYAATANWQTDYPVLAGEHRCDIAVVGAGFTGLSTALHLAERGYDVAIVEANRVGWGASGRNGGQLIDGIVEAKKIGEIGRKYGESAANTVRQIGIDSRDVVLELINKYGINCDLKFGFLDVALSQEDLDYFEAEIERKSGMNYPHTMELIPKDQLHTVIGSDVYIGGLVHRGNGHLHPLNLCLGEARAAEENGARIFERSTVTRIHHGAKPRIETADGVMHADKVVLAELASELLPQDMAVCDQRVGLDYYRLSADNRLLFGGLCNYSGRHPKDITASIRPKMIKVFPQLEHTRVDYEWGGYIAITIKRIPQMGRIQGNTYYAFGYSGHGLAPTHIAGQILADAICGDTERAASGLRIPPWRLACFISD
jgi:glycine/D-amino acid oxidase-like deaminating enzyme